MSRPRIVFMGTPDFAVSSLEACFDLGDVVAVVTQPDKPKGRGNTVTAPPVKELAVARGVPVFQPAKLRTPPFVEELRRFSPDVCVVTAYGRILPKDILELPPKGCVNVHGSLLPRFRGAAPIQWSIAHGDTETGVSLMVMDEGLDTGPVLAMKRLPIGPEDTSATMYPKLAALGGEVLREFLPAYLSGALKPVPQPSEGVVLAPIIEKEEGKLDFTRPAIALERRLRAFTPWPGAFTSMGGKLVKVHRVKVAQGKGAPGTVLSAGAEGIEVACGEGSLVLLDIQLEGKRVMKAAEFLTGHKLAVGSQPFGT
ncbi:methionyl-tRNA formyltransferase [Myxococcus sp. MISCRS1]|jgi:methionyl-tRNA formyltransferase|uniref:Methionyl-tRNA formyltransferase n=1 Tax=Myxococcus fulvus TaxID=33 RepID=A0A511ST05_MYXFU|nr:MULTISPECIES: methionyl-tRNA formyltransferase [Myxococcus]BDT31899.1 methionyl-tRNA formyltransferase [Myxococcus sp. MH1]MBZ4400340.1 methionyl-tRNA formyltransferase [Myxococcus sp. AS-1-15]MBZ4408039.1 methionyl-tRNA formyltransferase [Myxococcus sp. XM-1-1-1]MCY0998040.1 methionyl-tRNA formyltransferase [Myxococcus sp. MISCRS1]SET19295.1 methionyl-tRNA formyltransferase [Myxococcus fulvus]